MRQIIDCKNREQIASTYEVMKFLRPHLPDVDSYVEQVSAMAAEGFRLVGLFENGQCRGAMGFRPQTRLSIGRLIYVDDLVTDETQRSTGVGKSLLDWLKQEAKKSNIKTIVLDSGTQRTRAHKFYFREGFHIPAFNFKIDLE